MTLQKKLESFEHFLNDMRIIYLVLFGSSSRGKIFPRDVDLMVIVNDWTSVKDRVELESKFSELGVSPLVIKYSELFEKGFFWVYFSEGVSLKGGRIEGHGFKSFQMFMFRHNLEGSDKVRFYRALKLVEGLKWYGRGFIIIPTELSGKLEEFFEAWGIHYIRVPIMIPENFEGALSNWFRHTTKASKRSLLTNKR